MQTQKYPQLSRNSKARVELRGVHLCCQGCVNAVDSAVNSVVGVESQCDMNSGTVTITAADNIAAQKALDAIAAAGFHGHTDNAQLAMKAISNVPKGKIKSLQVKGIHNCCDLCSEAIKEAISRVDGVAGDTAKPKATAFEVTGDFYADEVVKALNAAGFSVEVNV